MSIETIGKNSGNIWKTLNHKGAMTISPLKKATKLNDKDLYMGLGWLAREGKLNFEQKGNQLLASLTE